MKKDVVSAMVLAIPYEGKELESIQKVGRIFRILRVGAFYGY